ncbi:MAG TPA: HNH endonuclease [Longimicrobium sp.]|nr:HNH endonuclease [Longimicrobium sp.]
MRPTPRPAARAGVPDPRPRAAAEPVRPARDANTWDNCVTACSTCNNRKADRTPAEAGLTLRVTPAEPHFVHLEWSVRRLTPLQRKYVVQFFGADVADAL